MMGGARLIAIIISAWRPGPVVERCITSALEDPDVDQVHVWGYDPTHKAFLHALPTTLYHRALQRYASKTTTDVLENGDKFRGPDSASRIVWRAKITLNMWAVLSEARELFPNDSLLFLENDAILLPGRIGMAHRLTPSGVASCYRPYNERVYQGSGNLCFIFTPDTDPTGHLLAYHLVQPADWILYDFSRRRWGVFDCVRHGIPGVKHTSTLDLT